MAQAHEIIIQENKNFFVETNHANHGENSLINSPAVLKKDKGKINDMLALLENEQFQKKEDEE